MTDQDIQTVDSDLDAAATTEDQANLDFQAMDLPPALKASLLEMNFTTATPIQSEAIPVALDGLDILGSAQTGTGKTGAFGIPLVAHLMNSKGSRALVMTPTRELATQVADQLKTMLGARSKIRTAVLIGGEPMPRQLRQLSDGARLIVGTPGRINDHLDRRSLHLDRADFLVLDETDRMLDMGFTGQIERVLEHMAEERQTLLFSATLPGNIERIANDYMTDPERIAVASTSSAAENVTQSNIRLKDDEKFDVLLEELEERTGSVIIFVKTKYGTEKMAQRLSKQGHESAAIHGDLKQNRRDRVIKSFREMKYRVLVATDVAARGLDIPHIEHVINYDLPHAAEDYIHRIGRTARAGAKGEALNLIGNRDGKKWRAIERLLGGDRSAGGERHKPAAKRKPMRSPQRRDVKRSDYRPEDNSYAADAERGAKASRRAKPARADKPAAPKSGAAHSMPKVTFDKRGRAVDVQIQMDANPTATASTSKPYKAKSQDGGGERSHQGRKGAKSQMRPQERSEGRRFDNRSEGRNEGRNGQRSGGRFDGRRDDQRNERGERGGYERGGKRAQQRGSDRFDRSNDRPAFRRDGDERRKPRDHGNRDTGHRGHRDGRSQDGQRRHHGNRDGDNRGDWRFDGRTGGRSEGRFENRDDRRDDRRDNRRDQRADNRNRDDRNGGRFESRKEARGDKPFGKKPFAKKPGNRGDSRRPAGKAGGKPFKSGGRPNGAPKGAGGAGRSAAFKGGKGGGAGRRGAARA